MQFSILWSAPSCLSRERFLVYPPSGCKNIYKKKKLANKGPYIMQTMHPVIGFVISCAIRRRQYNNSHIIRRSIYIVKDVGTYIILYRYDRVSFMLQCCALPHTRDFTMFAIDRLMSFNGRRRRYGSTTKTTRNIFIWRVNRWITTITVFQSLPPPPGSLLWPRYRPRSTCIPSRLFPAQGIRTENGRPKKRHHGPQTGQWTSIAESSMFFFFLELDIARETE